MSRLPTVDRDTLAPEDQAIWDNIQAVRTGVRGPFGVMIHVPALAGRVANLEDYFRFNAALPAADRELVILATARELGARYPWTRHEARGREVGTRTEAIEAVRANGGYRDWRRGSSCSWRSCGAYCARAHCPRSCSLAGWPNWAANSSSRRSCSQVTTA